MKLCIAGSITIDVIEYLQSIKSTQKINILQSYIDYRKGDGYFDELRSLADFFILDSGAFSMLYGNKKNVDIDQYCTEYIDFVKRKQIYNYVELDLYNTLGTEKTEQLRARLEQEVGWKPIPVFHKEKGLEYYKKLIREYDYVAIGGISGRGKDLYNLNIFVELVKMAKKENCKIHGLGFTSSRQLPKLHLYSVDSKTWLAALRYGGAVDVFDGEKFIKAPQPKGTKMITPKIRQHQIREWAKFMKYAEENL